MSADGDILVINTGSSSVKLGVQGSDGVQRMTGHVSKLAHQPRLVVSGPGLSLAEDLPGPMSGADAVDHLLDRLVATHWIDPPRAVGHRIVHGADRVEPAILCDELIKDLRKLQVFAPMHQGVGLDVVERVRDRFPDALQVASFDTAFHATQPRIARLYALPREFTEQGLIAYGFHGLSFASIARRLPQVSPKAASGRTVVLHLGSGVSLCALDQGRSVAASMGLTALDGAPMSTRCGAIDPGLVLHLVGPMGLSVDEASDLLYHRSGLLGLSGESGDMATLLASERAEAAQAIDVYCYRIARLVGSLAAALGGLDALVFTGGVGENAPAIRARIIEQCAWLGARMDAAANLRGDKTMWAPDSATDIAVLPADEEAVMAADVQWVLRALAG